MNAPLLQMRNICKSFPGVRALDNVNFEVHAGEVHCLLGENGAGKSTLIKILAGVYTPNEGEILLDGRPLVIQHPSQAEAFGISTVHQEINLEPYLSAAENIYLNRQPLNRFGLIDYGQIFRDAQTLLDSLGVDVPPRRLVGELAVAQRQMVSIAHAVSTAARIVIMDEVTAPLTEHETEILFKTVQRLKEKGIAVIYISHRLEEVFRIADRVTVLRDGQHIATLDIAQTNMNQIISMMIGRSVEELFQKVTVPIGDPVLEVRHLYQRGMLEDISLTLHHGEILGLYGLAGAGRTELARTLFGAEPFESGEIILEGQPISMRTPRSAIRHRIGLVPEDRRYQGLVTALSVKLNISLPQLRQLSAWGVINSRAERDLAQEYVSRLNIKTPSIDQLVMNLSGGNQQRVVLSKWLAMSPKVLILDEPSKGIDIGAKADIHALMCKLAAEGVGILFISSDLPEVLAMSDRILVLHRGRLTGELTREEANAEQLVAAATGEVAYGEK